MKKNIKNISTPIIATSLATIGFVSYKILKKKYPQKIDNVNENIKNSLNNLKIKTKQENQQYNKNNFDKTHKNKHIFNNINIPNNQDNLNNYNVDNKNSISNNEKIKNDKNLNNNIDTKENITFTAINVDNNITLTNYTSFEQETPNLEKSLNNEQINSQLIDSQQDDNKNKEFEQQNINANENELIQHLEPEELKEIDDFFKSIAEEQQIKQNEEEKIENSQHTFNQNINEILLPDNYIEDEIRYQLCLSNQQPITKELLQKLERIDFFEIDDYDIDVYCDFLAKYTNIKSIVIDALNPTKYNSIEQNEQKHCLKNISPLTRLKSLQEISFNWGIENIDFNYISSLTSLKKLEIKFGMLKDINFISNLKNLEHLEIMISNNVTDLSPLLTLSNLKNIYIYTNTKLDVAPLKNIKSLQNIYINGESITVF